MALVHDPATVKFIGRPKPKWKQLQEAAKRISDLEAERFALISRAGAIAHRVCIEAGQPSLGQKCEDEIDAALMPKSD